MPVFRRSDFSLASNSKKQFRINPATLGANNCRSGIDFPQFRFKRLDLRRFDEINIAFDYRKRNRRARRHRRDVEVIEK
jgi:hypothetical protein